MVDAIVEEPHPRVRNVGLKSATPLLKRSPDRDYSTTPCYDGRLMSPYLIVVEELLTPPEPTFLRTYHKAMENSTA